MNEKVRFLRKHFFTHKDSLPPREEIPGTLFTPLHFAFSAAVLTGVLASAWYVSRYRRHRLRQIFSRLWKLLVVLEVGIVAWESLAGKVKKLDLKTNLSLYPCSVFLFALPAAIYSSGVWQKMATGYITTVGLLGGAVNFFYPAIRLSSYSCISLPGFHTFFYHGAMLFTTIVMLKTGFASYRADKIRDLFLPCVPCLLMSVPANLINFSRIGSDYMFFRDSLGFLRMVQPNLTDAGTTLITYALYVLVPMAFFLPSYLKERGSRLGLRTRRA